MIIDNVIALRIMYLLVRPFKTWPACKQGIIDDEGNLINSKKKSSDWSLLHKMVAKLKRFIQLAPGGKSVIASLVGAYMLVKEQYENDIEYEDLAERYELMMEMITEEDVAKYTPLIEEFAGTGISSSVGTKQTNGVGDPIVKSGKDYKTKNKMFRRQNLPIPFKEFISDRK